MFLVVDGEATLADRFDVGHQRNERAVRIGRQLAKSVSLAEYSDLLVIPRREKGFSHSRTGGCDAPARRRNGARDLPALNLRQRHQLPVLENAEICGLTAFVSQPTQEDHRWRNEIPSLNIGRPYGEGLAPHVPLAAYRIEVHKARLLHRSQQAMCRRYGKPRRARQLAQPLAFIRGSQPRQQVQST